MNTIPKLVSVLALVTIVIACLLFFASALDQNAMNWIILAATTAWFIATPIWMGRNPQVVGEESAN